MQKQTSLSGRLGLITAMVIFGTIGLVRRYLPLPSGVIALARAVIGGSFLILWQLLRRQKSDWATIRRHIVMLLLSGCLLGFNWILLFEAYNYTSVAAATLCYYMAPMIVILLSPLLFREKLTGLRLGCVAAALVGVVLVSGILEGGQTGDFRGILLGLAAAVFYAVVVMMNKTLSAVPAYDKTIMQLLFAAMILIPYCLFTGEFQGLTLTLPGWGLLLTAGIIHTGIAYTLYFGSMVHLKAQTIALYSYLDPILAIILSALVLKEPMSAYSMIGAALILAAAFVSDRNTAE